MDSLQLPLSLAALPELVAFIKAFCADHGADECHAGVVQLVAEEVFVNIVHHGHGSQTLGSALPRITFSASREGKALRFTIEDGGPAFDPTAQAEADVESDLDDRSIGGLGVHFLRRMMNEVVYQRTGSVNRLEFVKYMESPIPE